MAAALERLELRTDGVRPQQARGDAVGGHDALPSSVPTKHELRNRLRRVEGQVRGVQTMIANDRAYTDVLDQIAAVDAALHQIALGVTAAHVEHCLRIAGDAPEQRDDMVLELVRALARLG